MSRKNVSDEELRALLLQSKEVTDSLGDMWAKGMKILPIKSRIYVRLCAAGRAAQRLHHTLCSEAEWRGWSSERMSEVRLRCFTGFN